MGLDYRRPRRSGFLRRINIAPYLALGGIIAGVAGLVCLIIFVFAPMFRGEYNTPAATPARTIEPIYSAPPKLLGREDMSDISEEIVIDQKSVNYPMINGNEMIYSTGKASDLNPPLKDIYIYSFDTQSAQAVEGVECIYNNILSVQFNDRWIVFLDVKTGGGGRICGYDRQSGVQFTIRDYFYGIPKISLDGDILAWITQTQPTTDKLYLCDLTGNETTTLKIFKESATAQSGCSAAGGELIWPESINSETTGLFNCVINRKPLSVNSSITQYDPGMYVYSPVTNGTDIAFLDGNRQEESNLMVSVGGQAPRVVAKGVLNYALGADFVAYTKDSKVYAYFFEDESTGCLTGKNMKGELASANGDAVVWYDMTDGRSERDVIRYSRIGATAPEQTPRPAASPEGADG